MKIIRKRIRKKISFLMLIAYIPVVFGGGECISICFDSIHGLVLDFSHQCGKTTEKFFSPEHSPKFIYDQQCGHSHSCKDFSLYKGDGGFSIPVMKSHSDFSRICCNLYSCQKNIFSNIHLTITENRSGFHERLSDYPQQLLSTILII